MGTGTANTGTSTLSPDPGRKGARVTPCSSHLQMGMLQGDGDRDTLPSPSLPRSRGQPSALGMGIRHSDVRPVTVASGTDPGG